MGLETRCQGRHGAESGEGRLQHEGDKILFRGAFRLDIPVKELKQVTASNGDLLLVWGKQTASFALGAAAAPKWAHKILNPPSLLDKLGIKPEQQVAIKGKFDEAFLQDLSSRVKPSAVRAGKEYNAVLMLAATPVDLEAVTSLSETLKPAGALWIIYPKGGKGIKESEVRQAALNAKLVDNKTCAFSSELTALRWVRPLASRSGRK